MWVVLVPIKRHRPVKTRLSTVLDAAHLAVAMSSDVLAAVRGAPDVRHVVVVDDAGPGDLNEHLASAAQSVAADAHVAVVMADLPCLTSQHLADLLGRATEHPRTVVSDAAGDGTTVLTARDPAALRPQFGVGSLARHLESGAVDLTAAAHSAARLDIDRPADLTALATAVDGGMLECGPATRTFLATAAVDPASTQRRPVA